MGIFSRKKSVSLEDFCRDFYDNMILNPIIGGVDFSAVHPDFVKKYITEVDAIFANADIKKLTDELMILRFELFALAWIHKFIHGMVVIAQSAFTKRYLYEKGRDDIWSGMEHYNNLIHSATLHWLSGQGKMNLTFNYNAIKELTANNIKDAQKSGMNIDESIDRVNQRLWSENAWKQNLILEPLMSAFCKRLSINPNELNKEAGFRLATTIRGLYDGAFQSLKNIKIKS